MNDKAKTTNVPTGLVLYRVNYSYIAPNGALRGGALVVEAKDIIEAQKIAPERLATFNLRGHKITSVREY